MCCDGTSGSGKGHVVAVGNVRGALRHGQRA